MKVTFKKRIEKSEEINHAHIYTLGRGNSKSQDPKMGKYVSYLKSRG